MLLVKADGHAPFRYSPNRCSRHMVDARPAAARGMWWQLAGCGGCSPRKVVAWRCPLLARHVHCSPKKVAGCGQGSKRDLPGHAQYPLLAIAPIIINFYP
ncbi:hypothetical protein Dimus_007112, partial [Dionaea muscipula]